MVVPFFVPAELMCEIAGPEETKNQRGRSPPPDSDPFSDAKFGKISHTRQEENVRCGLTGMARSGEHPGLQIADSSSRNAVSFSDTPDHAIGYALHRSRSHHAVIRAYDAAGYVIETHEHEGDFKEAL